MNCESCKRSMTSLFTSCSCDWCDFAPPIAKLHRGYVVPDVHVSSDGFSYVFRTIGDAERWRTVAGYATSPIVEVHSLEPFRWHLSRGVIENVVLADHMFEIFKTHRYEPLPHRAFITPGTQGVTHVRSDSTGE